MSDNNLTSKTDLLPCAKCGSEPMGSLSIGCVNRAPVVRGTFYHCLGDDCHMQGDIRASDDAARDSWNSKQREYV